MSSPRREGSRAVLLLPPASPGSALASARAASYGTGGGGGAAAPFSSMFAGGDLASQHDAFDVPSYSDRNALLLSSPEFMRR